MKLEKTKLLKHIFNIFLVVLGTFIMGTSFNLFFKPNNIVMGGFGGISMLISALFAKAGINVGVSIIYLVLNSILFIVALKVLGKRFSLYALVGILSYSLFLEICKFPAISSDLLLSSIYGACLSGLGVGLTVIAGGSTGGGNMLGCIINKKWPKISIGWFSIGLDSCVIFCSILMFGLAKSLYSIIAIFISGKTVDLIIEGPRSIKAYYIISKKPEDISASIMELLNRGVTSFKAYGKYSGKNLEVLMCLLNNRQVALLKQIIYDIDKNAFLFSVPVSEAMGNGFRKLEKRKSLIFKKTNIKPAKIHKTFNENSFIKKYTKKPLHLTMKCNGIKCKQTK